MKFRLSDCLVVPSALLFMWVAAAPVKAQAPLIQLEPLKQLSMTLDELNSVIHWARGYKCPDLDRDQAQRIALAAGELEDLLRHYPDVLKEMRISARERHLQKVKAGGRPEQLKQSFGDLQRFSALEEQVGKVFAQLRSTRKNFADLASGYFGAQHHRLYPVPPQYPTPEQRMRHLEKDLPERVLALANAAKGFSASRPIEAKLDIEKNSVKPGERITVRFQAAACLSKIAWVGIVPSDTPHGSEDVNDQKKIGSRRTLGQLKEGRLTFEAPMKAGSYDLRMNDGETTWPHGAGLGKELTSVSFTVTSKTEQPVHPFHGRWKSNEVEIGIAVKGDAIQFGFTREEGWDNNTKTTGKLQGNRILTTWEQACMFHTMKKWVRNKNVPARLTLAADGKSLLFETRVIECKQERLFVTEKWEHAYGGNFVKVSDKVPNKSLQK